MREDFAILILTHGRPDNVMTIDMLERMNYTGKYYLVIDDEDKRAQEYYDTFGRDKVVMFNKKEMADRIDEGNNFNERRTITHARNASFDVARKVGVKYFMQFDDDYSKMAYKYRRQHDWVLHIDVILESMLKFYENTPNILSLAFAQGGDFIGGVENRFFKNATLYRKCMNSFICSVDRPFQFTGAMNEDVNTYTKLGNVGKLFFTMPLVSITQQATQSQAGGITDMYLEYGTMAKAFTTVMYMPSCVSVSVMGTSHQRLHHKIKWRYCVPKILDESVKK